ncbi:MAG: biotin transporter BioY [Candidatus Limnocylindria bacterium]
MTSVPAVATRPVLADRVPTIAARDALLVVAGTLVVAASAQVVIPLPFTPVPITGSTFGVLLAAAALGPMRGFAAIALYWVLGVSGLPFFQDGNSGLTYALGATGGYLVGFFAASLVVGLLARRGFDRRPEGTAVAFIAGSLVIYAFGVPWLAVVLAVSLPEAIGLGLTPFLIGDALKAALAAVVLPLAWRFTGENR